MSAAASSSPAIFFVRHGQTDWNKAGKLQGQVDIPLNETGKAQAQTAAEQLDGRGITRVVTSTLGRAMETGGIIAAHLGLDAPSQDEGLLERAYGEFEGVRDGDLPDDVRETLHPGHERDPRDAEEAGFAAGIMPGVERSYDCGVRGAETVKRLRSQYPEDTLLLVSHGTLIRLTLNALDDWKRYHPGLDNLEVRELTSAQLAAASS
ncbi:MAG: histidine phosphatase family protein [Galactobacter sp.]|uniref:histidine phosphatase family protein n=1 Tax=Galactobacter sp. TaxID=2676125 RepID=UPI0025C11881|nr:histidine phosphatase family protein [Galactobacter sp.]